MGTLDKERAYREKVITDYPDEDENEGARKPVVIEGRTYRPGTWVPGQSGNPSGKPKGKSMKEWTREMLGKMTDEERQAFLSGMPKLELWRMAEGNPTEDRNVSITVPRPILDGLVIEEAASTPRLEEKKDDTSIA